MDFTQLAFGFNDHKFQQEEENQKKIWLYGFGEKTQETLGLET